MTRSLSSIMSAFSCCRDAKGRWISTPSCGQTFENLLLKLMFQSLYVDLLDHPSARTLFPTKPHTMNSWGTCSPRYLFSIVFTVILAACTIFNVYDACFQLPSDQACAERNEPWTPVSPVHRTWQMLPQLKLVTVSPFFGRDSETVAEASQKWNDLLPGKPGTAHLPRFSLIAALSSAPNCHPSKPLARAGTGRRGPRVRSFTKRQEQSACNT